MKISNENIRFSAQSRDQRRASRKIVVLGLCLATGILALGGAYGAFAEARKKLEQISGETLSYGSRAGMNVTITARDGIGTGRSVITAKLTEVNARAYCAEYAHDPSTNCVQQQLKSVSLAETITADCVAGEFTNFYGEKYRYVSAKDVGGVSGTLRNIKTGELLDGSAASGLSYNLQQFDALCPRSKSADAKSISQERQNVPRPVTGRLVQARRSGVLPGAIICPDLELVRLMQIQFARHWEETAQDSVTRGQSQLIRGRAASYPAFAAFGCALIQSGGALTVEAEQPVPIVSAQLPNGMIVRGVTFAYMYGNGNSPSPF